IPTVKENELKVYVNQQNKEMASGDQSAGSPMCPVKMQVSATEKLEVVTALLVTQENP
ncbi:hypothetical protein P7K49_031884, partial [Saguinus oedipus]